MSKLENINDLRNFIAEEMTKVSRKETTPATANAIANLAGKLISTVKAELEYHKMMGAAPNIPFVKKLQQKSIKNKS